MSVDVCLCCACVPGGWTFGAAVGSKEHGCSAGTSSRTGRGLPATSSLRSGGAGQIFFKGVGGGWVRAESPPGGGGVRLSGVTLWRRIFLYIRRKAQKIFWTIEPKMGPQAPPRGNFDAFGPLKHGAELRTPQG